MLHLRTAGLLDCNVRTVTGTSLDENLNWWEQSERRRELKKRLHELDSIDASQVILSPDAARASGLTPTICFPAGNLAPEGSVIKSTAIDPSLIDEQNAIEPHRTGPRFCHRACRNRRDQEGRYFQRRRYCMSLGWTTGADEEIYQVTSALKARH